MTAFPPVRQNRRSTTESGHKLLLAKDQRGLVADPACASNANQLDRATRSDGVLLRRGHKLLMAPLGAEVIGLPPVLLARRGRGRVDLHPAHRIGHRRHHFPLPALVLLGIMPAPSNGDEPTSSGARSSISLTWCRGRGQARSRQAAELAGWAEPPSAATR